MHVLFVEDDPMNRTVVRDMLSTVEVDMSEAEGAEIGLELIDHNHYDAILMDLRMPGMDGLTAIRHIRSRADAKAKLPVIVITADTAPGLHDQCRLAGADEILGKPVPMEALFDALGSVLDRGDALIG